MQISKQDFPLRHDWTKQEVEALYNLPFGDLIFKAQQAHRAYFEPNQVQISTLLSIKTGGCPEDCAYCPQSAKYNTGVKAEKLLNVNYIVSQAKAAKEAGAGRFCMGAAWREVKDRDVEKLQEIVKGVKGLGLETCMTLGMLEKHQAVALKDAGLDYYNHNLDSSPEFYGEIISTRDYENRLQTLEHVRNSGMKTCCGGIVGMGEEQKDRAGLLLTLANLPEHPGSVPINMLVQVEGTPLHGTKELDPFDFVRTIAVARILMPASVVRLSAGREQMNDQMQALCFMAGANSIFYGDKLLTTSNPQAEKDRVLLNRLGLNMMQMNEEAYHVHEAEEEHSCCGHSHHHAA